MKRRNGRRRSFLLRGEPAPRISVVNLWEIRSKASRGRLAVRVTEVQDASRGGGFAVLAVEASHVRALSSLPFVHDDPFDGMLVAQAKTEPRYLLTAERRLRLYGEMIFFA